MNRKGGSRGAPAAASLLAFPRIGGDAFAVLARNVESRAKAAEIGQRFVAALRSAVVAAGRSHPIGVSVGAALFPDDGRTLKLAQRPAGIRTIR